jgi:hypothetical protein
VGSAQRRQGGPAGYSGTPLAQKLGIRAGARLFLRQPPANYFSLLAPLPANVRPVRRLDAATDLVHVFAKQRRLLAATLQRVRARMRADAAIWVSWPKRSSGVSTDISEDVVRELALPLDLVDIKVCAVDETWSGLKLVLRLSARRASAATERRPPRRRAAS